jgi:hypothetical protein
MSIVLMNASSSPSPVYAKRLHLAAQLSDRGGVVQIEEMKMRASAHAEDREGGWHAPSALRAAGACGAACS